MTPRRVSSASAVTTTILSSAAGAALVSVVVVGRLAPFVSSLDLAGAPISVLAERDIFFPPKRHFPNREDELFPSTSASASSGVGLGGCSRVVVVPADGGGRREEGSAREWMGDIGPGVAGEGRIPGEK